MKNTFATKNELRELIDEFSTPKMKGQTFKGIGNPRVLLIPLTKVLYWDGKWNGSRSKDDLESRIPTLREDFSRKSNGQHNVDTRQPLPILAKYSDRDELYLASGYGRVLMFKRNNQPFWLFLVYEISDKKIMKPFMGFWNDNPRQSPNSMVDKVCVMVNMINDGELDVKDLKPFIQDTYVVTTPEIEGKLIEEVRRKVKAKMEVKEWEVPDKDGELWAYAIDKQFSPRYKYLKRNQVRNGKIGKLIKGGNGYFAIKFWTIMRNYKSNGLKTEFYGYTNTPKNHKSLTRMRLNLYNEINNTWNEATSWGVGKRKPFTLRGFYPSDKRRKSGERQDRIISVKQMLKDANSYGLI